MDDLDLSSLSGREIVVGVGGGIACYKVCDVVSKLVQSGAGVTVAMTDAAQKFVTPLTFEALTQRPVHTGIWTQVDAADTQHIKLTETADLLLVAPATMHLLCKCAAGLCDDVVSLLVAASACPILMAPSMNDRMWANAATVEAVEKLKNRGVVFVGPDSGVAGRAATKERGGWRIPPTARCHRDRRGGTACLVARDFIPNWLTSRASSVTRLSGAPSRRGRRSMRSGA